MKALKLKKNFGDSRTPNPHKASSSQEANFTLILPPIFMFLSVLGLVIASRWELLGGAITIVFQLAALSLLLVHSPITHDFPRSAVPYLLS